MGTKVAVPHFGASARVRLRSSVSDLQPGELLEAYCTAWLPNHCVGNDLFCCFLFLTLPGIQLEQPLPINFYIYFGD